LKTSLFSSLNYKTMLKTKLKSLFASAGFIAIFSLLQSCQQSAAPAANANDNLDSLKKSP
jgi:hypothetical protein